LIVLLILGRTPKCRASSSSGVASRLNEPLRSRDRQRIPPLPTWLVAISWKRFILLSVLLMIIAGVLSEIPPFTWTIMETAPKVSRLHTPSGDGRHHDRRARRADQAQASGRRRGRRVARRRDQARDHRWIRAERESSHVVRLGDFLPQLAFLFIVVSTAIKMLTPARYGRSQGC